MDPRDFLGLARRLRAEGDAAALRTAVSRAYYAVYLVAGETLQAAGVEVGHGHAAHTAVQRALGQSQVPVLARVAARLRRLQDLRVTADYRPRDPHPERLAVVADWLEEAARMIATLDAAAADPATRARLAASRSP